MRISDWSSDVCSSDLVHKGPSGPYRSDPNCFTIGGRVTTIGRRGRMQSRARRIRGSILSVIVGIAVVGSTLVAAPAAASDAPPLTPWPSLLPSFTTGYQPSSANECKSSQVQCVDAVIDEMARRVQPQIGRAHV